MPVGGVPAGGGATAHDDADVSGPLMAAGGAALVALAAGGVYVYRRRRAEARR
ncbi:LPXTG cell wall anchor domain-containing protein [Saccharopolyspora phatthalungensis]|uniref:LPXTG-motif cell wall-anchored protein n=1 Tax=Saccharopolyspora phatthalungensis TaxID=664693 RepID=A0A840Q7L5_9PSEU|nr:LPXTG cell wall anchor domain-containing protein [Saccharopolyspora phatthalungensis]MBB5158502.1 LPXTG-motif cell wall-anchored protein [Saccharopolyspora phatthalungensis]